METVVLSIVIFICSIISGATALAGGIVILGFLYFYYPLPEALAIHGMMYFSINVFRVWLFRESINWKVFFNFVAASLLVFVPMSFVSYIPDKRVSLLLLGVLSLAVGLFRFIPCVDINRARVARAGGAASIFTLVFLGLCEPILDILFTKSKSPKEEIIGTKSAISGIGQFLKVIYFVPLSNMQTEVSSNWPVYVGFLILLSLVGVYVGKVLAQKMSDCLFRRVGRGLVSFCGVIYLSRGLIAFF